MVQLVQHYALPRQKTPGIKDPPLAVSPLSQASPRVWESAGIYKKEATLCEKVPIRRAARTEGDSMSPAALMTPRYSYSQA